MFAVQTNKSDGRGWQIIAGPMPREAARNLKREHVSTCEGDCKIRVVPTGEVKEEIRGDS